MPAFELGDEAAPPEPSLTEPFDVGQALFDPARLPDAVVSVLALVGVEIVDADGNVLRAGKDTGAGKLVLTEAEVRGLIDMTRDDLASMNETGVAPITINELYQGVAPSLPAGYSIADFVDGYARAYAEDSQALVPQILLGMPITEDASLTRLQAWLLYIDGFLGRRTQTARTVAYNAQSTAAVGHATSFQPPLTSQIPGLPDASWTYLLSRLPTLAYTIRFTMQGASGVHEGHGGQGQPAAITATVSLPPPLTDPATGQVILEPHSSPSGITMRWNSAGLGTLTRHGTLDRGLLSPVTTDAGGAVRITYTPKKEAADGQGQIVTDVASLFAEADAADLVRNVYFVASSPGVLNSVLALVRGKVRSTPGNLAIRWHEKDTYEIYIRNRLDVSIEQGTGGQNLMKVRRDGRNEANGVLYNNGDGTYRGSMLGWVDTAMNGTSFVGECHDRTDALQWLYVVGHVTNAEATPPFVLVDGTRDTQKDLMLYFYPASPPSGTLGKCQGTMDFPGGGPDGQPGGAMLPFNDTMWTASFNTNRWQDMLGLRVYLPEEGTLETTDNRDIYPELKVFSQWNIVVTKPPPP